MRLGFSTLSSIAVAVASLCASVAHGQTVTTTPVGFVASPINPGFNAVGVTLVKEAVFTGEVISVDGIDALTLSSSVDLTSGGPYYLEATSGTGVVGERFDIVSAAGAELTLDLSDTSFSTSDDLSILEPNGQNVSVVIREHFTIGDIGDAVEGGAQAGDDSTNSDQILLFRNGFKFYWVWNGDNNWYENFGDIALANDFVVGPGEGVFYYRNPSGVSGGTATKLRILGAVRTNSYLFDMKEGYQLLSVGFPVDSTPEGLGFDPESDFVAGPDSTSSDLILTWDNGFKFYWLWEGDNQWYQNFGDILQVSQEELFKPNTSFLVFRRNEPTVNSVVPSPVQN